MERKINTPRLRKALAAAGLIATALKLEPNENSPDKIVDDTHTAILEASNETPPSIESINPFPEIPAEALLPLKGIGDGVPVKLSEKDRKKIDSVRDFLKSRYNVEIQFVQKNTQGWGNHKLEPVIDAKSIVHEIEQLKAQLIKIPPEFLHKTGVQKIIFSGKITEYTEKGEQDIAANAPIGNGLVYVVYSWPLYHELFHKMDAQFAGALGLAGKPMDMRYYKFHKNWHKQNTAWAALEPEHPEYDPDEDQAEYCRILFNLNKKEIYEEQYKPLLKNTGQLKKLEQMKQWLFDWSDGVFNEEYWKDLQEGKVGENYWQAKGL